MPKSKLTHATGAPVVDNLNIKTAGPRGPALLQDIWQGDAPDEVKRCHIGNCNKADPAYGAGVAKALELAR